MHFWRFAEYKRCITEMGMEIKTKIKKRGNILLLKNNKEIKKFPFAFRWKCRAGGHIQQNNMQDE